MSSFLSHLTPLQWFNILVPILVFLIALLRWVSQRGKPRPVRTYRQGCMGGLIVGLIFGIWIGIAIAFTTSLYSMRFK